MPVKDGGDSPYVGVWAKPTPQHRDFTFLLSAFFSSPLEAWPKSSNAPEEWGGASPWKLVSRVASREYVGVRAILVMLSQCIFPRGTFRPGF